MISTGSKLPLNIHASVQGMFGPDFMTPLCGYSVSHHVVYKFNACMHGISLLPGEENLRCGRKWHKNVFQS